MDDGTSTHTICDGCGKREFWVATWRWRIEGDYDDPDNHQCYCMDCKWDRPIRLRRKIMNKRPNEQQ